jgi:hypothetical protein
MTLGTVIGLYCVFGTIVCIFFFETKFGITFFYYNIAAISVVCLIDMVYQLFFN